jgi:hypothetical protein
MRYMRSRVNAADFSSSDIGQDGRISNRNANLNQIKMSNLKVGKSRIPRVNVSRADQKVTQMVIIMCVLTVIEHALVLTCSMYPLFNLNLTTFILYAVSCAFWSFKRILDVFVFLKFNCLFRQRFIKVLRMKKST